MTDSTEKTCRVCKRILPLERFGRRSDRGEWSYRSECKECIATKQKQYRLRTKDPIQSRKNWSRQLKHRFGISVEEYEQMLVAQSGGCAICGCVNVDERRLAVDHDHKTGRIRGLLCHHCNVVLGHVNDSPARLRQLIAYIKKHSEQEGDI